MRRFVRENYPIDSLPRDLHPHLPEGRQVRVIVEDDVSDEEMLAELDQKLAEGLKSLNEGRFYTAEEVLARLDDRFGPKADAAE